jgi:hypothetical protein
MDLLWPDLPQEERRAAMGEIRKVVENMVAGGARPARLSAADAHEARVLGVAAFTAGMGPLMGWWFEEGRIEASSHARDVLMLHLRHGRLRSARLRDQTCRIARAMHHAGIHPILLKGMHTAGEFFPDPATRPTADIDLLVATPEHALAEGVLADLGFTETNRPTHVPRSDWSLPNTSEVASIELDHAENAWNVDLHASLDRWYFRGLHADLGPGLLDTSRRTQVDGEHVRVLDQPYLLAFLALHAGYDLSAIRLVRLVELVWVIRAELESRRLDWAEFGALLERTGTSRFVYPALALAEELAPDTVGAGLLRRLERSATPRMHRVLDAVRHAELGPLHERSLDVKLAWAIGGREALLALSEVLLPTGFSIAHALETRMSLARWRITRRITALRSGRGPGQAQSPDGDRRA